MATMDCGGCEVCCFPCMAIFAIFACCTRSKRHGPCFPCCKPLEELFSRKFKKSTDPELDRYASEVEREMSLWRPNIDTQPDPHAMPVLPKIENPVLRDRKEGLEGKDRRRGGNRSKSRPRSDKARTVESSTARSGRSERSERDLRDEREHIRGGRETSHGASHYIQQGSSGRQDRHHYPPTDYPTDRQIRYGNYDGRDSPEHPPAIHQPNPTYPAGHRQNQFSQESSHSPESREAHHDRRPFSQEDSSVEPPGQHLSNPYSDPRQSRYDHGSSRSSDYIDRDYPPERRPSDPHSDSHGHRSYPSGPGDAWAGTTSRRRENSDPEYRSNNPFDERHAGRSQDGTHSPSDGYPTMPSVPQAVVQRPQRS